MCLRASVLGVNRACNDYILIRVMSMLSMATQEINVPLGVREFLPHWIQETILGDARGAQKQYRYGNLHIRRYADRYTVHVDHADPRRDVLGHLIHDSPETLIGALSAPILAYASYCAARWAKGGCANR